jgi:tetratricopeptide (TPR) repeat protein
MCKAVTDESCIDGCLMAMILIKLATVERNDDLNLDLKRERLALDIRSKHLPLSHPLIVTTHSMLADVYLDIGKYEEALKHCNEALRLKLRYLPNGHLSKENMKAQKTKKRCLK